MVKGLIGGTGVNDFNIKTGRPDVEPPKNIFDPTKASKINPIDAISYSNIPGAVIVNFSEDIFDRINFNDRKYILREAAFEDMLKDVEIEALADSISDIGLINPIYVQETLKEGKPAYRIVSGYRRSCAIALIKDQIAEINEEAEAEEDKMDFEISAKFVLVPSLYTADDLDVLQVNENSHRDDLKVIELGYKLHAVAKRENISLNQAAERYNLSPAQGKRYAASINYPLELKLVLEEVGPSKGAELNKLIKLLSSEMSTQEIVDTYKAETKADIEAKIKEIKKGTQKKYIIHKRTKKNFSVTVQESLSEEEFQGLLDLMKTYIDDLKK